MERGVSPQARPTPQRSPQMHPTPPVPGMVLAPTTLASSIGAPGSSASASMRSRHGPKMLHRKSSKGSAVEHHSSQRLQDTFWELHRKLGERYTADMAILAHPGGHAHANSLQSNPLSDRGSAVSVSKLKESGDLEHSDRQLFAISDRLAASHASQLHASQISSMPKSSGQGFESESLEDKDLRQIRADGRKEEEPVDARGSPRVVLQEIPATPEQDTPHSVVPDAKGGQHPLQIDFRSRMSRSSEFSDDHVFVPRLCWINKSKSLGTRRKSRVSLTGDFSQSLPLTAVTQEAAKKRPWYWPRMIVLNPTGNFRSFWDFLGMLILLKDTIGIPLQLVDVDVSSIFPPWDGITKFSVIYWCFDIFFSFFTGYLDKGTLVSDFKSIAWHYLKTWFLIDLAVSLTDLLLEFGNFSSSIGESATATRFLRFLRLFRMLRLGKVSRVSAFLQDQFESKVASIQFSLALVMLAMILVEHVIACVWFGLGDDPGETWLTQNALKDSSFWVKYYACVRWALAQLGFGATAIEAINETEGMYSNFVGFVSLVTSSSVISSMTSLVGALHRSRSEETQQLGMLRRFLRQNQVDPGLSERIMRFLQYTYHAKNSMGSDNPQILSLLSQQLQNELQYERYKHVLDRVLFLKRLIEQEELSTQQGQVLQKISMAVVVVDAAEDDTVFCAGGLAEACFFILQGSLRYTQVERPTVLLQNAGAAAEMTLWTEWTFVGDLVSTSFSKIAAIQVDDFERCIVSSPELQHEAHGYAAEYIEALNELELLSDLWRFGHRHSLRDFVKHRTGRPSILQRGLKLVPKRWVSWRSWLWPSRVAPEKSPSRSPSGR